MKVAALQMTSGADVQANLTVAGQLLESAARSGAVLAVLPENFAFMGLHDADKRKVAEPAGRGPIQDFLAAAARRLRLWIVGGTVPLQRPPEERVAAASLLFSGEGRLVARYDKIHLFDVDLPGRQERYLESAHIAPGSELMVAETPAGKLGLSVCYDVRFPELFRSLSFSGAQLFSVPSAFTAPTGRAHWETLLRARAIENLCYVIAPAQSGIHPSGRETYGDTLIIDYWGRVLGRKPRGQGVVVCEIDLEGQGESRASFPALRHRVM
ncbi:MAG TPA: carbon-nitrogen hydrolase family protein [Steroidobacteraceae bacterium]|nr:carbon-nitrogen hydrolase family protein [Steroidobacteraceae bacterium]